MIIRKATKEFLQLHNSLKMIKEFLLYLYDKLWTNITNKENRLWNFLAFYGVGIGVILGTATDTDEKLSFGIGFFLLVITYWAAEITLSADWWSVRNRLMIRGIESRTYEARKGIIPGKYHGPKYSSESLHVISLLVLALLAVLIFSFFTGVFEAGQKINNLSDLIQLLITYSFSVFVLGKCANKRENLIKKYYIVFRELNRDFKELNRNFKELGTIEGYCSEKQIDDREKQDKNSLGWRLHILFFYVIFTLILTVKYHEFARNNINLEFQTFLIFQVISLLIFIIQWIRYKQNLELFGFNFLFWKEKNWLFSFGNFLLILFILISLVSPLWNIILEGILNINPL